MNILHLRPEPSSFDSTSPIAMVSTGAASLVDPLRSFAPFSNRCAHPFVQLDVSRGLTDDRTAVNYGAAQTPIGCVS